MMHNKMETLSSILFIYFLDLNKWLDKGREFPMIEVKYTHVIIKTFLSFSYQIEITASYNFQSHCCYVDIL